MHEQQFPVRKDAPSPMSENAIASSAVPAAAQRPKRHGILWALLTLAVVSGGIATASFVPVTVAPVPLPTLDLEEITRRGIDLAAKVIVQSPQGAVHIFSEEEARAGFTAPADTHVLFTCPSDFHGRFMPVYFAHGDISLFNTVRYWGYEYSGNEKANKAAGKKGRELFNGRFWLSEGELAVTGALYGHLNTIDMTILESKMYYLMVDGETLGDTTFRVSCIDTDNDNLNDGREDMNGNGVVDAGIETDPNDLDTDDDGLADGNEVETGTINPLNKDSDNDGVQDGTELAMTDGSNPGTDPQIFIPDADPETTTNPMNPDTDGGGLSDGQEDVNFNGKVDEGETDPNDAADDVDDVIVPTLPACGDGNVDTGETCDDGQKTNGDGCSDACAVEYGWTCTGSPSVCTQSVASTDLGITAAGPTTIQYGESITYQISVSNSGNPATGVKIWNTIPSGFTFISATTPICRVQGSRVECALQEALRGNLPITPVFTITFSVAVPQPCIAGTAEITFNIESPVHDPVPANNQSVVTTSATCPSNAASCGNGITEPGGADGIVGNGDDEACDDSNVVAADDCSANCSCDHWNVAETFLIANCSDAIAGGDNAAVQNCYLTILGQWNGVAPGTPPAKPDTDCSGVANATDISLLTSLVLRHYPE